MQQHENFIMGPWEVCGMPSLAHKALASNLGLKLIQCSRLVKSKKLWLDATSSKKGRRNQFEHDLGMEMGTTTYLAFPCSVLQIWFKYLILPELCPMRIEENRRKLISRA